MSRAAVALLALMLGISAPAHAQPAAPAPASDGPPDPRRGERLDGRSSPKDPMRQVRAVARAVLAVPRWVIEALFWPVVQVASFVETRHLIARTYWAFTSEDRKVGLRPEARYETGLIASLGAKFFDRRSLGRGSLIELRLRTGGQRFIFGEVRLQAPHDSSLAVELRTAFERNASRLFSGTHGESRAELTDAGRDVASFGVERALSGVNFKWQIATALQLALHGEVDVRTYHATDSLDRFYCAAPRTPSCAGVDDALVPGFHEGLRLVRGRAGLLVDSRRGGRRVGGVRLALDAALAHGILGDPSAHASVEADARLALALADHALILRLNGGLVAALGDAPVPFDELLSPSGNDGLRGLSPGRLRGHSQLFGSVEYRWLLAPYLDAALFVDHGGAFDRHFAGLSLDRMIPSYGFGLHVHHVASDYWYAAPLFWFQIAHAPDEGVRLMIGLGSSD